MDKMKIIKNENERTANWEKNILWPISQIKRSEETSLVAHEQWAKKRYA